MAIGEMGSREPEPNKADILTFDPDKDITGEDWEGMRNLLEKDKNGSILHFLEEVAAVKIINPNEDLKLDSVDLQDWSIKLQEARAGDIAHGGSSDLSSIFMAMKILKPKEDLKISSATWNAMRRNLEECRRQKQWGEFSSQAMEIKVLNPDEDLKLDPTAKEAMRKKLEEIRERLTEGSFSHSFSRQAMAMKILNPDEDLKLDQADWRGMRDRLDYSRRYKIGEDFILQAMKMKILVADKVVITGEGVEITTPKR